MLRHRAAAASVFVAGRLIRAFRSIDDRWQRSEAGGDDSLPAGNGMPLVATRILRPTSYELALLQSLSGETRVSLPEGEPSSASYVLLSASDERATRVATTCDDVGLRFECFTLQAGEASAAEIARSADVVTLRNWHRLFCLLEFQWLRPAAPREASLQQRGRRSAVPADALAVGACMPGFVFWNADEDTPVAALFTDDHATPGNLVFLTDSSAIEARMRECEQVAVEDIDAWTRVVDDWLEAAYPQV